MLQKFRRELLPSKLIRSPRDGYNIGHSLYAYFFPIHSVAPPKHSLHKVPAPGR